MRNNIAMSENRRCWRGHRKSAPLLPRHGIARHCSKGKKKRRQRCAPSSSEKEKISSISGTCYVEIERR